MVVKPQLIVAEDCLLLSSDSRCSGQTSDNLRQRKDYSRKVWGGGVPGDELIWRVGRKNKDGGECGWGMASFTKSQPG